MEKTDFIIRGSRFVHGTITWGAGARGSVALCRLRITYLGIDGWFGNLPAITN